MIKLTIGQGSCLAPTSLSSFFYSLFFNAKVSLVFLALFLVNDLNATCQNTQDSIPPNVSVTDIQGNELDPFTSIPLSQTDCTTQVQFFVQAIDDCDGIITANDAVWVDLDPSAHQESSVTTNGLGFYVITLDLKEGTSYLTIHVKDADGNIQSSTFGVQLFNNSAAEITYILDSLLIIPHCRDSTWAEITIVVDEACKENIGELHFSANGTEELISQDGFSFLYKVLIHNTDNNTNWTAIYTDKGGDANLINIPILVHQAEEDQSIEFIAGDNHTIVIPDCRTDILACLLFEICNYCSSIDINDITFDGDGTGLSITYIDKFSSFDCTQFEVCGTISPGSYTFTIGYGTDSLLVAYDFIQEAEAPPVFTLPENLNYTIPVCETVMDTTIKIHYSSDCDNIYSHDISVLLGQTPLPLIDSSQTAFTYALNANEGGLLSVSYTGAEGQTTSTEADLIISYQADLWPPRIISPTEDFSEERFLCDGTLQPVCVKISALDNCEGIIIPVVTVDGIIIDTGNSEDGIYCLSLSEGAHTVYVQAEDSAGNASDVNFTITVLEVSVPDVSLSCIESPNIPLGANCEGLLSASQVLTGEWACLNDEDFTVLVMDGDTTNGALIDSLGTYSYRINVNEGIDAGDFTQCVGTFQAVDSIPPVISCPIDTPLIYSVGPYECSASFAIPSPIVEDECSDYEILVDVYLHKKVPIWDPWCDWCWPPQYEWVDYRLVADAVPGGFVSGLWLEIGGNYYFRFKATDSYGNTSTMDCPFEIIDDVLPTASCDDQLRISIGGNGGTRIYAYDLDEGSNDNCGDVGIQIRQEGGDWADYVEFSCENLGDSITLELGVWDDANRNGTLGDAGDNFKRCYSKFLIEDRIIPYCTAPEDVSTSCSEVAQIGIDWSDTNQLNQLFGTPVGTDNCQATATQTDIVINTSDCGWGTVVRTFTATDDFGLTSNNSCSQTITIYDGIIADVDDYAPFCVQEQDCLANVEVLVNINNYCATDSLQLNGTVDLYTDEVSDGVADIVFLYSNQYTFTYRISGYFPEGNHLFHIMIANGCGDQTNIDVPFEVIDCSVATPVCNELLISPNTTIDGCCAVTLSVNDFVTDTLVDCHGAINYSVHLKSAIDLGTEIADPNQTALTVTFCTSDTAALYIYAWDHANNPYAVQPDGSVGGNNHAVCETNVINTDNCTFIYTIAGRITTEEYLSLPIEGVEVVLNGTTAQTENTDSDGNYIFHITEDESDVYTITPSLNELNPSAVNTLDLALITQHILGNQLFHSPYKMIAADVNKSASITTADLLELRGLILGNFDEFPNNTFWRFISADYAFSNFDPLSESFPESVDLNAPGEYFDVDFIGLAVGDVDNSVTLNFSPESQERSDNGTFHITTQDRTIKKGTSYQITFNATDLKDIQGYQFSLEFDISAIEYAGIDYGLAVAKNFGLRYLKEGIITSSWNPMTTPIDNNRLFTFAFKAKKNGRLSDFIHLNSRITPAAAYKNNAPMAVQLDIEPVGTPYFEVSQNMPNPFTQMTHIEVFLPTDSDINISIRDVSGKILQSIKINGKKGLNPVTIHGEDIHSSGVLFYTVSTKNDRITKRMILMDK